MFILYASQRLKKWVTNFNVINVPEIFLKTLIASSVLYLEELSYSLVRQLPLWHIVSSF